VQPYDIWVLKSLEDNHLLKDAVIGRPIFAKSLALELIFVHFLKGKLFLSLDMLTEQYLGEASLTEGLYDLVVVNHRVSFLLGRSKLCGTKHR
jgi:hypothetical protein